jgi:hypothetical protein
MVCMEPKPCDVFSCLLIGRHLNDYIRHTVLVSIRDSSYSEEIYKIHD